MLKLVITAALCPAFALAQDLPFVIKGKMNDVPGKVYLSTGEKRDSAVLTKGVFEFKGTVEEPILASLYVKQGDRSERPLQLYLEKGTITVFAEDSLHRATVTAGPVNKEYQAMKALAKNAKEEERKPLMAQFVKDHPNSVVSLYAIQNAAGYVADIADVEPLYNMLTPAVQKTAQGQKWAATIAKLRTISVGATAPSFVQNDTTGKPVKLEDFRGQYVLIDFWASWCKPCRAENPVVIKAYDKYKSKNFTVLGISIDTERNRAAWLKAIHDDKLPWPQVSDLKMKNEAAELYDVHAIPQNFLLDPQGKIVAKNLRGEELEKKLQEVLGKG